MGGYLGQPLYSRVLVSRIRPSSPHVEFPRDYLMDEGLLLLLQQRDQFLLGADVAPDASVGVVEEACDGSLLHERWERDRQVLQLCAVDMHDSNPASHGSLLRGDRTTVHDVS